MERKISTRKVDELGRIVTPHELRSENDIGSGDGLDFIAADNGDIILRKPEKYCAICKSTSGLTSILGKSICKSCKEIISNS